MKTVEHRPFCQQDGQGLSAIQWCPVSLRQCAQPGGAVGGGGEVPLTGLPSCSRRELFRVWPGVVTVACWPQAPPAGPEPGLERACRCADDPRARPVTAANSTPGTPASHHPAPPCWVILALCSSSASSRAWGALSCGSSAAPRPLTRALVDELAGQPSSLFKTARLPLTVNLRSGRRGAAHAPRSLRPSVASARGSNGPRPSKFAERGAMRGHPRAS